MQETFPCGIPKDHLDRLYTRVEAAIKGSMTVLSDEEKRAIIKEEMLADRLREQTHPNVYNYLVSELLDRT